MVEGEPRNIENVLSEKEWDREVEQKKPEWLGLCKQIVEELDRVSGKGTGMFELLSREVREEMADRVNVRPGDLDRYAVFHWMTGSTPQFKYSPNIDLPGNLIEKAFREKLEKLKKENNK